MSSRAVAAWVSSHARNASAVAKYLGRTVGPEIAGFRVVRTGSAAGSNRQCVDERAIGAGVRRRKAGDLALIVPLTDPYGVLVKALGLELRHFVHRHRAALEFQSEYRGGAQF